MNQSMLIVKKEWLNFVRGDRSIIFFYAILMVAWGLMFATLHEAQPRSIAVWIVSFSFIISFNFLSTVFVLERLTGSLELLFTSGLSRGAILYGKMAFVMFMTLLFGAACVAVSLVARPMLASIYGLSYEAYQPPYLLLFATITFLNTACSAYFSVLLPNPRWYFFITIVLFGFIVSVYSLLPVRHPLSLYLLEGVLVVVGAIFTLLARRAFESERIVKPVVL